MFVLLCGCLPFDDDSAKIDSESDARAKFVLRFPKWAANLSASAQELLRMLLAVDPKDRCSAAQALRHPWVIGRTTTPNNFLQSPSMLSAYIHHHKLFRIHLCSQRVCDCGDSSLLM